MTQMAALGGHWTLAISLGIGLLVGIERERTKGEGAERRPAGVRTFALVGLLGGLFAAFDDRAVLAVGAGFVGLAAVAGYVRSGREDPGLTTEIALVVVFLLGALARDDAPLAAGIGVVVTILLASRTRLHDFVSQVLSDVRLPSQISDTIRAWPDARCGELLLDCRWRDQATPTSGKTAAHQRCAAVRCTCGSISVATG